MRKLFCYFLVWTEVWRLKILRFLTNDNFLCLYDFLKKNAESTPLCRFFGNFVAFTKKTVSISFFPLCTIVSRFYLILDLYKSLKTKTLLLTTKFLATKMFDFFIFNFDMSFSSWPRWNFRDFCESSRILVTSARLKNKKFYFLIFSSNFFCLKNIKSFRCGNFKQSSRRL